jgi:hypothetical protein
MLINPGLREREIAVIAMARAGRTLVSNFFYKTGQSFTC